jgi:hypothetical protein
MGRHYKFFPALLLVAGVAVAAPACAAQTYGYGYPRSSAGYGRDIERRAYDNGYREGIQEGRNDAQHNRNFSPERHSEFRDADNGYHRGDGDRDFYRRAYRQGFQTGYRESFDRIARGGYGNGGYGNRGGVYNAPVYQDPRVVNPRGGFSNIAAQNGYRDGIEAGRNDARDRSRFDPVRAKRYREGDHDYNNRYGDRDTYKREYRAAFEQGYREGYGQVR